MNPVKDAAMKAKRGSYRSANFVAARFGVVKARGARIARGVRGIVSLAILATLASGCGFNVFSLFDKPADDAALLAYARACLDRTDYDCAATYYGRLAGSSDQASKDRGISESAFSVLARNGAGMRVFLESFGTGKSSGKGLTAMANAMKSGAGETRRLAIHTAFATYPNISNASLKALTRFVTALALSAELLAEGATASTLVASDLSADSTLCTAATSGTCPVEAGCDVSSSGLMTDAVAADIDTPGFAQPTGAATWDMVYYSVTAALAGLNSLSAGGTFSGVGTGLTAILGAAGPPSGSAAAARCFRNQLYSSGIGSL